MRHRVKKIKIKFGKDANKMLFRKLAVNFFVRSKLTTTKTKAKFLKSIVEKLVEKTKKETESNKNCLLKYLGDPKLVKTLFEKVGPSLADKTGGYVRVINLLPRDSDGADMARVEWAYPVIMEEEKKQTEAKVKKVNKSEKQEIK